MEERTVECSCGQKHILVIDTKYSHVLYNIRVDADLTEINKTRYVSYDLIYQCPVKSLRMQVTLQFPSYFGEEFRNAAVIEVK